MYSQMRKIERLEGDEDVLRGKINKEEKSCSDGKQTEVERPCFYCLEAFDKRKFGSIGISGGLKSLADRP